VNRAVIADTVCLALCLALCLAAVPASAQADAPIQDGQHLFQLTAAPDWTPAERPSDTLLAYRSPDGAATAAVIRIDLGRAGIRDQSAMIRQIVGGIERATPRYRKVRERLRKVGAVPVFDLSYRRRDREERDQQVYSRMLLYRRHTVVLSIVVEAEAKRAVRTAAQTMLDSFTPYLP